MNYTIDTIIISNYFISNPFTNNINYYASIVWKDIEYIDSDYNSYPSFIIYRDDIDKVLQNKYNLIIDELTKKFYQPTTYYKHFDPKLEKIPLTKIQNDSKYKNIVKEINKIISN